MKTIILYIVVSIIIIIQMPLYAKEIMDTGVVRWFNPKDGFGSIKPNGGGQDVFVHFSTIITTKNEQKTLNQGDTVVFKARDGKNGRRRTVWVKLAHH
ncbi:MAG: cold shock domain-containing protein [Pseudomonadota bacterium]|nr:cold shock domain-containing protein [Pseudomonadota bacterium]